MRAYTKSPWVALLGLALGLGFGLICAASAQAEPAPPTVVVIVEPGGGMPPVERLRDALSQLGIQIVSQRELGRASDVPDALLSLTIGKDRVVSALYWDRSGRTDALSAPAPAPAPAERVETAVVTLAAALLSRHLHALAHRDGVPPVGGVSEAAVERELATRAVYAALARLGLARPRTALLSVDDF